MLSGKKIILGVTGSIAAYKAAVLARLLVKAGAEVQVIMTAAAHDFISPLTLSTLTRRPVLTDFVKDEATGQWANHVELGLWADLLLIAPATAHTLARLAHAHADDLLTATYLSARCPVWLAPAMDLDMYAHPATQACLQALQRYGNTVLASPAGELASGLSGPGRMDEPEAILQKLQAFFSENHHWQGRRVLITAGPTREPIDPVRYISNHSTGKMGYALARTLAEAGAVVTLVSGPTALPLPHPAVERTDVQSAREMFDATEAAFPENEVVIFAAAVADYTPATVSKEKIKKKTDNFSLELRKTTDIAATLGDRKRPGQWLVGFALETHEALANARRKLQSKNLDLLVLNSLQDAGAGFGHDTNRITLLHSDGSEQPFPLKTKNEVAADIVAALETLMLKKNEPGGEPGRIPLF